MKSKRLPVSKAKTAYDLLTEVRQVILEEPKRYYQGWWLITSDRIRGWNLAAPACGTVACVAGWINTLRRVDVPDIYHHPAIAADILGLPEDATDELFDAGALDGFQHERQTPAYARAGEQHITRFQEKYAKQLKARQLPPVKRARRAR